LNNTPTGTRRPLPRLLADSAEVKICVGYELTYDFQQPTPAILVLGICFARASDAIVPDLLRIGPSVPIVPYRNGFGNWCTGVVTPAGRARPRGDGVMVDSGQQEVAAPPAAQESIEDVRPETLVYPLGSRYCETDRLTEAAWQLFGTAPLDSGLVEALCDFVHRYVAFGYEHARPTKTAWETFDERTGVCCDYADVAMAFCRASCLRSLPRWISRAGSRPISVADSTLSTCATVCRGSVVPPDPSAQTKAPTGRSA
jgi:Transglutaminase-like superfamily